jgi:hypothetical protein
MKALLGLPKALDRIATLEELREASALYEGIPEAPDLSRLQEAGFPLDPALNEAVVMELLWLTSAESDSDSQVIDAGAESFVQYLSGSSDLVN